MDDDSRYQQMKVCVRACLTELCNLSVKPVAATACAGFMSHAAAKTSSARLDAASSRRIGFRRWCPGAHNGCVCDKPISRVCATDAQVAHLTLSCHHLLWNPSDRVALHWWTHVQTQRLGSAKCKRCAGRQRFLKHHKHRSSASSASWLHHKHGHEIVFKKLCRHCRYGAWRPLLGVWQKRARGS